MIRSFKTCYELSLHSGRCNDTLLSTFSRNDSSYDKKRITGSTISAVYTTFKFRVCITNHLKVISLFKLPWRWYTEGMLVDDDQALDRIKANGITFKELVKLASKNKLDVDAYQAQYCSSEIFIQQLVNTTASASAFVIASYSRRMLNQSGNGHFAPIAAYHVPRNLVLIADVAQYKYPFHWMPVDILWKAMTALDKDTSETRGFMVVKEKKTNT